MDINTCKHKSSGMIYVIVDTVTLKSPGKNKVVVLKSPDNPYKVVYDEVEFDKLFTILY